MPAASVGPGTTLVFQHLPKTGGSTLRAYLEQKFSPDLMHLPATPAREFREELRALPLERRAALRCVGGHLFFGIHELLPNPCAYFTLLRDPVERVISLYAYAQRRPDLPIHELARSQDLAGFVERGGKAVDNVQTRFLSGAGFEPEAGACGRELLERAQAHLAAHFAVVGTTERFAESVGLLRRAMGWREREPLAPANVSESRPLRSRLEPETIHAIERCNELDRELHAFAARRLQADLDGAEAAQRPLSRTWDRLATAVRARLG